MKMDTVSAPEELLLMENNKFIGTIPVMKNSRIRFSGDNNILYCDKNVRLKNCNIYFAGNNSVLWLSSSKYSYKMTIYLYSHSVIFWGKDNSINGDISITASEQKNVLIGSDNLFSTDIWIRNSDAHLLYDALSKKRINCSKSVYIGDHVWIGQQAVLLKGTNISSGSIIGARSVLSNKHVLSNTVWAGNPARQIRKNVFWDERCVHKWTKDMTETAMCYEENPERFLFFYKPEEHISYDEIERQLTKCVRMDDKLDVLRRLSVNNKKDRFSYGTNL